MKHMVEKKALKDNDKGLLLGRAKQLRGFGSQHLATVRVMGLVINKMNT